MANTSPSGVGASFEGESLYSPNDASESSTWPRSRRMSLLSTQSTALNDENLAYETNTLHYAQPRKVRAAPVRPTNPAHAYGAVPIRDFEEGSADGSPPSAVTSNASRKQLLRPNILEILCEVAIAAWAMYSTVRYLITFSNSMSRLGYGLSLFLGISSALATGMAVASLIIPFLLAFSRTSTTHSSIPLKRVRLLFAGLVSVLVLLPAITNVVLTTIWRGGTPSPELDYTLRCHWDIDVLWSGPTVGRCIASDKASWIAWLGASIGRMIFTTLVIAIYLFIKISRNRHAARIAKHKARTSVSHFNPNELYQTGAAEMGELGYNSGSPPVLHMSSSANTLVSSSSSRPSRPRKLRRKRSETPSGVTLVGSSSGDESDRSTKGKGKSKRPPLSRASTTARSLQPPLTSRRVSSDSVNSASSASPTFNESMTNGYPYTAPNASEPNIYSDAPGPENSVYPYPNDGDLQAFANHIRSLIVTQDTRSMSPSSPGGHSNNSDSSSFFQMEPSAERPPDERVVILNQTIRRMPTIESFGSRENSGTTIGTGGVRTGSFGSLPPTRTNTIASDGTTNSPQGSLRRRTSTGPAGGRSQSRLQELGSEAFNQDPILGETLVQTPEAK